MRNPLKINKDDCSRTSRAVQHSGVPRVSELHPLALFISHNTDTNCCLSLLQYTTNYIFTTARPAQIHFKEAWKNCRALYLKTWKGTSSCVSQTSRGGRRTRALQVFLLREPAVTVPCPCIRLLWANSLPSVLANLPPRSAMVAIPVQRMCGRQQSSLDTLQSSRKRRLDKKT